MYTRRQSELLPPISLTRLYKSYLFIMYNRILSVCAIKQTRYEQKTIKTMKNVNAAFTLSPSTTQYMAWCIPYELNDMN